MGQWKGSLSSLQQTEEMGLGQQEWGSSEWEVVGRKSKAFLPVWLNGVWVVEAISSEK